MVAHGSEIVEKALAARTPRDAEEVQGLIQEAVGARYQRPVGDRWNNHGLLTASGSSYDHKVLEVVTNMQDAVLELRGLQEFGSLEAVPFRTPHDAAEHLLRGLNREERAKLATVTIDRASTEDNSRRRITLVMRDLGCGITPSDVPRTIFQIGANRKNGIDWLVGTFGMGGATTYRNARAVVLVTRRHPDLLGPDEEDRITVAVVQWERVNTTTNAFYLVTSPWKAPGDQALPFSVPASIYPEFEPGTHLALISYATEGLARRSGDERSFDTVFNTRLYRPTIPISYRNLLVRSREEVLDGLERRLRDNPGQPGSQGEETLPFKYEGRTYHLPIRFRLFAKPGQRGERRNFVAYRHAVVITSNGQVHAHWEPQEFKLKTRLKKLYDRIFVVVESDALPIEVRTQLFTADRAQLVRDPLAVKLEREIAAFLDGWGDLWEANAALIREAITGDSSDRPTLDIARKIARAIKAKGFSVGAPGSRGGGPRPPQPIPPEDLYEDPTHFEGPEEVEAMAGTAKSIYFKLNAKDGFLGPRGRATLEIACDHPDIGPDDITVGNLRAGRVRVSIAVPNTEQLGTFQLRAVIPPWTRSSGGLGTQFEWTTKLRVVDEATSKPPGRGAGKEKGRRGAGEGDLVALVWKNDSDVEGWDSATVGDVEWVAGKELAAQNEEYKDLADVDADIPTIILNRTYSPLKRYIQARAAELTDEGKEAARDRYAVGAGVALLVLDEQHRRETELAEKGEGPPPRDETYAAAKQSAARGVLSVLPEYDRLAKEIED